LSVCGRFKVANDEEYVYMIVIELVWFRCVFFIWAWNCKLYNLGCGKWWVRYWKFCGLFQL